MGIWTWVDYCTWQHLELTHQVPVHRIDHRELEDLVELGAVITQGYYLVVGFQVHRVEDTSQYTYSK
jgi:hypothetical protein